MRLLAAALVSTTALLAPRAPSPRKAITRTTRRHAVDEDDRATHAAGGQAIAAFALSFTQPATPSN